MRWHQRQWQWWHKWQWPSWSSPSSYTKSKGKFKSSPNNQQRRRQGRVLPNNQQRRRQGCVLPNTWRPQALLPLSSLLSTCMHPCFPAKIFTNTIENLTNREKMALWRYLACILASHPKFSPTPIPITIPIPILTIQAKMALWRYLASQWKARYPMPTIRLNSHSWFIKARNTIQY